MKKFFEVLCLFIIFSFVLTSCKTFYGYYYDLEKARSETKFYENSDYLFVKDSGETIVDFVIKEHILYIVEIEVDNKKANPKYKVKHSSTYSIEEAINRFEQFNDYDWITTSNLSLVSFSWCVVSENFNLNNGNYPSFDFVYRDISYSLCYNMSN